MDRDIEIILPFYETLDDITTNIIDQYVVLYYIGLTLLILGSLNLVTEFPYIIVKIMQVLGVQSPPPNSIQGKIKQFIENTIWVNLPFQITEWVIGAIGWCYTLYIWDLTAKFDRESASVLNIDDDEYTRDLNAEAEFAKFYTEFTDSIGWIVSAPFIPIPFYAWAIWYYFGYYFALNYA